MPLSHSKRADHYYTPHVKTHNTPGLCVLPQKIFAHQYSPTPPRYLHTNKNKHLG